MLDDEAMNVKAGMMSIIKPTASAGKAHLNSRRIINPVERKM
jgi:hypothetical protein